MGYASYTIQRNGQAIEAGYAIETTCERGDCSKTIDRGLAHLCGQTPGGDEHGCGGYYCGSHLYMSPADGIGDLCGDCIARYTRQNKCQDCRRTMDSCEC